MKDNNNIDFELPLEKFFKKDNMQDIKKPDHPWVIAIGGGKGGVGKSMVCSNLSASIAKQSAKRVLVCDLDVGSCNLHTYLGSNIQKHFFDRQHFENICLSESWSQTSQDNLLFASIGNSQNASKNSRDDSWRLKLKEEIISLKTSHNIEYVVLDLGAGTDQMTLDFFNFADQSILVVVPEPSSIENAYSFIRYAIANRIQTLGEKYIYKQDAIELSEIVFHSTLSLKNGGVHKEIDEFRKKNSTLVDEVFSDLKSSPLSILLNQSRSKKDHLIADSMSYICQQYFGWPSFKVGLLEHDEIAWKSLLSRRLLIKDHPGSLFARSISNVSNKLIETSMSSIDKPLSADFMKREDINELRT